MNVPSTVAITVEMKAMRKLRISASTSAWSANGWSQLSNVNSCQTALKRPLGLLKLNATMTKIGTKRYSRPNPATRLMKARPMRPPGEVTVPD